MKLITAIIRPEKLNQVLEALFEADVRGLTITRAQGHGGELEQVETYRGTTVKMELVEKVPSRDRRLGALRAADDRRPDRRRAHRRGR